MIFLIAGESHTGKTLLAQKLLEIHHYPYISLDHLKMGLLKGLSPRPFEVNEDIKIAKFLYPIVKSILQTHLENNQNLILEGIYLYPKFIDLLIKEFKNEIKHLNLLFSKEYIVKNYELIYEKESVIERRLFAEKLSLNDLIKDHLNLKKECLKYQCNFLEFKENYELEFQKALKFFS
ncbi:adenylate kinase [Campylobacter novaezeelandiae]|uniref:adenylate kinase n=1 Tax=Campylobacter novaezeelandiae TaxID=2267891 RepID=UPI001037C902|nr:adenylate kinase [Campylobacter novaezeelandiae]QWU79370.1 putative 2-phosphoglycerate kinase [Campylobacter novaezeelandiae]TBR81017.1 adenylate kinase [Campylobacter novaezeelandiae]